MRKINVRGNWYGIGDYVALIGYNMHQSFTSVMKIDEIKVGGNKDYHIKEYDENGVPKYSANAQYIKRIATKKEIEDELQRRMGSPSNEQIIH